MGTLRDASGGTVIDESSSSCVRSVVVVGVEATSGETLGDVVGVTTALRRSVRRMTASWWVVVRDANGDAGDGCCKA
jgi:hypothetical protein